jgi:hypothetical protein
MNGSVEDWKAAARIYEGATWPPAGTPGLSLHELRQVVALLDMDAPRSAERQFWDLWNDGRKV